MTGFLLSHIYQNISTHFCQILHLPCNHEKPQCLYLVAERLAGQAELSTAHFDRHVANLLPAAGFGLAHDPETQMTQVSNGQDELLISS